VFLLFILTIGIIIGCGKLKDEDQPGSPVGTSGGIPYPIAPPSSVGVYTLSLYANPETIPADGISFTNLKAKLEDSSGRSVENFIITFNTTPTSDAICYFQIPPTAPGSTVAYSTTTTGRTHEGGTVSVRMYGFRAGSCVVQATVNLDELGEDDLFVTTTVGVTGGTGVPGTGVPGVKLTVDDLFKEVSAGVCTDPDLASETFTLTADVWDETGAKAGAGVRVELSGDISSSTVYYDETDNNGQATWTVAYSGYPVGLWDFTVTATVVINGVEYSDPVTFYLNVTCDVPTPTPTPTVTPTPTPVPVTLTLTPNPSSVLAGNTTSTINILATDSGGAPLTSPITVQLTTTGGTLSINPVTFTGTTNVTLTYTGVTPATITVLGSVTTSGYSGSGNTTVTFN